ncbi:MAG: LamG-like jellyroll fold domain-containing protein [Planctomycetota bacterium]|jgi:sugar lactone lactonase YvrE
MKRKRKITMVFIMAAAGLLSGHAWAEPVVQPGYAVEAYVTGLQNTNAIAFSPGGDFGYEGELFVGDSRPNPGTIYRVPSKDDKIFFASAADNEPRTFEFAPVGSPLASGLYVCEAYSIKRYDSSGARTHFAGVHAFGWDLAFAPDGRFRNNLFHADGWEPSGEAVREWMPDGTQTVLVGPLPEETSGLAFGPGGAFGEDLYVAFSSSRGSTPAIRKVTPDGIMTDFVVSGEFAQTNQLAFDTTGNFNGNLFVSDFERDVIFEINPSGEVSVFASELSFSSTPHHKCDGGDLAFGPDGALYVADGGGGVVWRIFAIVGELDSIEITGPDEVAENSRSQYEAHAYYAGGTVVDVTSWADWSVEPDTYASIDDSGMLTTEDIDRGQQVTVRASFTSGDVTVEAEKDVHIFAICPDGTALEFDGVDDFVFVPDNPSLDITGQVTLECWIKLHSRDVSPVKIAFGKRGAYIIYPENHIYGGTGNWKGQISGTQGDLYGTTNLEAGNWYHLGMTYDGTTMRVYLNGQMEGERSFTGGIGTSDYNLSFGIEQSTMAYALHGTLDDVRIWNSAKTQEEIKAAMHMPLEGGEPNLVGYWNFDESEGQMAGDLSGNGNDGTLGSTPDVDDSDPMWVESDAPVGICSPYLIAKIALRRALRRKAVALGEVSAALEQEALCLDALDELLESGDYGDLKKGDIVKASQRTHSAMQHEEQSADALEKSIERLEDASEALGVDE